MNRKKLLTEFVDFLYQQKVPHDYKDGKADFRIFSEAIDKYLEYRMSRRSEKEQNRIVYVFDKQGNRIDTGTKYEIQKKYCNRLTAYISTGALYKKQFHFSYSETFKHIEHLKKSPYKRGKIAQTTKLPSNIESVDGDDSLVKVMNSYTPIIEVF